jgi:hypothetical protein
MLFLLFHFVKVEKTSVIHYSKRVQQKFIQQQRE